MICSDSFDGGGGGGVADVAAIVDDAALPVEFDATDVVTVEVEVDALTSDTDEGVRGGTGGGR